MVLKFKVTDIGEVSEDLRSLYVKTDSGYMLNVSGVVEKTKLDEFRQNNVDLMKKLEMYGDVDPDKIKELVELERKAKEKELIDAGDVDGLIEQRVKSMRTDYEAKVNQLTESLSLNQRQLEVLLVDNAVREFAGKTGVTPQAVDDVLLRAKHTFTVDGGRPIAKDSEGQVIYGRDGTTPLTVNEWVEGLKKSAPHLFGVSAGAGGQGGGRQTDVSKLSATQKISAGLGSSKYRV